jgi:hypothetical protein
MAKRVSLAKDLAVVLLCPLFATAISFLFKTNSMASIFLFLGLPAIYLSVRAKEHIKKSAIFSVITGVIIIPIDYIAHLNKQWLIQQSIIPYKLFGFVTLEAIVWAILNIYLVVMFYEYFLDKHLTKKLWSPNFKYLFVIILVSIFSFILVLFGAPFLLKISYFYLILGLAAILLPLLLELLAAPKLISKFFKMGAYFFYLSFLYEVTALKLGWWSFPGIQFVGWLSVFGVRFPLEEFVFWIILFAMAVAAYYEFFDDDIK